MLIHGAGADIQQLSDHGVTLPAGDEDETLSLPIGKRCGTDIFVARNCPVAQQPSCGLEGKVAQCLSSRHVVLRELSTVANGEMTRTEDFPGNVIRDREAVAHSIQTRL